MWIALLGAAWAAPRVFVGATLHPVVSPVIEDGVLVVDQGRIAALGPRGAVKIPEGAELVDVNGKVIIPGLVDTHSHIGGARLNEMSGPFQPQVSAVDSFDATHVSIRLAQAGGITTANVMPGSGNLVGGQTAYVKLRDASVVDDMLFCKNRHTEVCGGMKMANGTNPQGQGGYPRTRMGATAQLRQRLLDVQKKQQEQKGSSAKRKKRDEPETSKRSKPLDNVGDEAMRQVLAGERRVHFHTHRADDVATILDLREEFGLDVVLHHVSEAWKVADEIAEAGVPCSLIVIDSPGGKEEAVEFRAENGRLLESRGVLVSLHTDDPITDSRLFFRSAGLSVRAGMSEAGALRALTLSGAEQLGLQAEVGSLEVNKAADFVLLDGPPLSVYTRVLQTWVDGTVVFDRSVREDRHYAEGGYAVGDRVPDLVSEDAP